MKNTKTPSKKKFVGFYAGETRDTRLLHQLAIRMTSRDRELLQALAKGLDRRPGEVMRMALRDLAAKERVK